MNVEFVKVNTRKLGEIYSCLLVSHMKFFFIIISLNLIYSFEVNILHHKR